MRLDRLGTCTSVGLEAKSCTGCSGLLRLGLLGVTTSSGVGCSFISGFGGSSGACGGINLDATVGDCWWLVA